MAEWFLIFGFYAYEKTTMTSMRHCCCLLLPTLNCTFVDTQNLANNFMQIGTNVDKGLQNGGTMKEWLKTE